MRTFLFILVFLVLSLPIVARDYTGTMTVGEGYTMHDVHVTLQADGTLTLYRVKFARMMPIRVDVTIPNLSIHEGQVTGDSIVPMVGDKSHPSRMMTSMHGSYTNSHIRFDCLFGGKPLRFDGTYRKD